MKLHEVPEGKKVRVIADAKEPPSHREFETGEILTFSHIDGMYSLCTDSNGNVVHIVAWAEVEVVE